MSGCAPPEGWMMSTVAKIAKSIQYGHTASATDNASGPRFLRITDIQDNRVNWASVPSCDIPPEETEKYRLSSGDIVFARTGATTGKSFLIRDCPDAVFASYLIRLRMHGGINPPFVHAFFQTNDYWRQIEGGKRGIGQPNVNASVLGTIQLPVAPLNEQRRIVAKIEELFSDLEAGVAALERARANLKRYRASLLKAAVEGRLTAAWRAAHPDVEPASKLLARILTERRQKWEADQRAKFAAAGKTPPKDWRAKYQEPTPPDTTNLPELPPTWCWAILEALTEIVGGITKDQKRQQQPGVREVAYLRVANVQRGYLDLSEVKTIFASETDVQQLQLLAGDVLFTEGGDRDKLGRGWVWSGEVAECVHQNHIFRARPFPGGVDPYLLSHHGNSFGQYWFSREGKQTTNLASINLGILRRFPVPIPTTQEQREIVNLVSEKISQIEAAEVAIDHGLRRAARLRQSILKQAFTGQLVPQDPADEPASELLARLIADKPAPVASVSGRRQPKPTPARRKAKGR